METPKARAGSLDGERRHVGGGCGANEVDLPQAVGSAVSDGNGVMVVGNRDG